MARKRGNTPALPPPAPPLGPGDLAGNFRIVSKIGEGGMGAVYKAERVHTGEPAVIKVLLPALSSNPDAARRFVNEARAASAVKHRNSTVKHRNIITVHDIGQRPDGQWYIAMEFLEGASLAFKLHSLGAPMGTADIVQVISQAANALHDAHEHGIVHRDVKPENLFLTRTPTDDDHVTVLDFGIAKIDDSRGGGGTSAGAVLGTPLYMAPEQLRGEEIDRRADVYALAAVTWEMATGEPLWGSGTEPPAAILERQRMCTRPLDPGALKPHIPPAFGAVVARALAFERNERYPTMQAFALALANALTTEYGESGIAILRRVASELTILDAATDTAGRPLVPPHVAAATIPAFAAVPASGIPAAPLTPPPAQVGRADLPTIASSPPPPRPTTLGSAAGVSQSPVTAPGLVHAGRQPRRRALVAALSAAGVVLLVVGVVVASSGSSPGAAERGDAPPAPAATSALAIVTEPTGAAIYVDGVARGPAPINIAAVVGSEVEVRAELAGYGSAVQRVRITAEPAAVRLTLGVVVDGGAAAVDAGPDAAPAIDAGVRRRRPPAGGGSGSAFDPDGFVQP